jgi:hypothetical protein
MHPDQQSANTLYRDMIVKMKDGNFFKIREVLGIAFDHQTIFVLYVEDRVGWVSVDGALVEVESPTKA